MQFESTVHLMRGLLSAANFLPFTLSIVTYVLSSLGLYTFAKRRMINHAWLSWVPVADMWILGSLSDQYRYVSKGQKKSKRKILLGLNIANAAVAVLGVAVLIAMIFGMASDMIFGTMMEDQVFTAVFGSVMGILGLFLLLLPLTIVTLVFRYMALYDLYMSCDPENAVLFLVLSIVIHVTEPFFLFFNRDKDKGMPPRRVQPEQVPSYEVPQYSSVQPEQTAAYEETRTADQPRQPEQTEPEEGTEPQNHSL